MEFRQALSSEPAPQTLRRYRILPTRQRVAILDALRSTSETHISPDRFHRELTAAGSRLSLATVYNTLNQFAVAGLVRRIGFGERIWFCTDPALQYHFFNETQGTLEAVPISMTPSIDLPEPPEGTEIRGVDVIVRLRDI